MIKELHKLKAKHPRWGYKKIHRLLVEDGWKVNHKRVQRLWRQEGLGVVRKSAKKKKAPGDDSNACHVRKAEGVNHVWSVDFVQDRTEDGKTLKILTVLDEYSREALAVEVRRRMTQGDVWEVIEGLARKRGNPGLIRSDNGSEFVAKKLQACVKKMGSECAFVAPGSPWQNGKNERFNGILRQEVLRREIFYNLEEARYVVEKFRVEYNEVRPHGALNFQTPLAFSQTHQSSSKWFKTAL